MERKFHSAFTRAINYFNVAPYIYRYENQQWIDRFFETGEIKLSSFLQYSKYEDNQLGDKSEGSAINFGLTENNMTISTVTNIGSDFYCFCTSTQLKKELLNTFNRNCVFRIKDPINFMMQIEMSLKNIIEVLFGNCIYLEKKSIVKKVPSLELDKMANSDGSGISMEKMMSRVFQIGGIEQLFLKKLIHQEQNEYRLLWKTDRIVTDPIIIECPEAIKFCEKVEL
jgi:hypothetical protein